MIQEQQNLETVAGWTISDEA